MSLMYRLLLRRSGLSTKAAAKLHNVTIACIKDWNHYKGLVPITAIALLDRYCRGVLPATDSAAPRRKRRRN